MPKRKADTLNQSPLVNGTKKTKHSQDPVPSKSSMLYDSDSGSSEDESGGGAKLEEPGFKINEDYAQRFEHNKKRAELHRLEEKYQKPSKPANGQYGDKYDEDSESSNDEDEDDDGFLATEALDAEISATLQAIRSKDPRVYDEKITFYAPIKEDADQGATDTPKEKPMYLRDYHRENLLKGNVGAEDEQEKAPRTYAQVQEDLKKSIVKEMHAAADDESDSAGEDDDEGFLVAKPKPQLSTQGVHPSRREKVKVDVKVADKDPESFLSNFMAARAWLPSEGSRFQPLESDDDEEADRAEKFEAAYNLRFEDPKGSNEILKSYARDIIAAKSVRREEPNSRKKQRDLEREKKEAEKADRGEDRARLRRLKIEEMEGKLQKIKRAAGMRGKALQDEEWAKFLDEGWDDDRWEAEMNKQFGEGYYAEEEVGSEDEYASLEGDAGKKKRKAKKPKWDDDIDITDLVPEFKEEEKSTKKPAFTLSDEEVEEDGDAEQLKSSKDKRQDKQAKKKAARLERKKIEELVDGQLDIDLPLKSKSTGFRYRETSPISFGLTAKDILMAPDSALNQFAGLKKMAAFRDAEKKRKDKKNLSKKARLRQWRKDTFGDEDEPEFSIGDNGPTAPQTETGVDIVEGKKKKKRSRKSKGTTTTDVEAA